MADQDRKVYGELTPDEIEEWENTAARLIGHERTLQIALNTLANHISTSEQDRREFWIKLGARLGFNPDDQENPMKLSKVNGTTKVVALTQEEKDKQERNRGMIMY